MPQRVGLFVTCLTDQFYPQVGIAVTKVLEHFGCQVHFPNDQTCCGQPFYNNGYPAEAAAMARRMIEIFEGFDYVVTPSASCCAMVRVHYPELLAGDHAWETGCRKLVASTYEFLEFLQKVLKVDLTRLSLPQRQTITYHPSCHLRSIGGTEEPVRILEGMGNVDYRPMEAAETCCGFGGTFAVKYPPVSGAIVEQKVQSIAATGAETTICNEAGCSLNISGMGHRQRVGVRLKHIAELVAEALGIDVTRW